MLFSVCDAFAGHCAKAIMMQIGTALMNQLILTKSADSSLPHLLAALGAAFTTCTLEEALARSPCEAETTALILSEAQLVAVSKLSRTRRCSMQQTLSDYQRLLVYPFAGTVEGLRSLGDLVGARIAVVDISSPLNSN